jgi:phosphoserine phosphatase
MNIYDFDDTIYNGDSGIDFFLYSLKKHKVKIKCILKAIIKYIGKVFGKYEIKDVKDELFDYLKDIKDLDLFVEEFWNKHEKNIKKWYLENQKEDDVLMTASCDIWIYPICKRLNIKHVICTQTDKETKKIIGKNCKGKNKIEIFNKMFPNANVENAYSDSLSDLPMFEISKNAYLVKKDKLIKYEK